MKKLSIKWLVLRHGIEKYLVKNFKIFVPNSAGNSKLLGFHTSQSINLIFPLISKLISTFKIKIKITDTSLFYKKKKKKKDSAKFKKLFDYYGSDKSTVHNYHLIYSSIFSNKNKVKKILEIGLGTGNLNIVSNMGSNARPGASLKAFKDFFKYAQIYGADIDKKILFKENRIKTFYVDQSDIGSLERLYKKIGQNFDLIIDDGLHAPYTNLNFIITSINKLKKGGWLIIEDIPFRAQSIWEIISFIISLKYKPLLIRSRNGLMLLVNKKKN